MKTAKELASLMVGDGKIPNKYFITIGFGSYAPSETEDHVTVKGAIESCTIGPFDSKTKALEVYGFLTLPRLMDTITRDTMTEVIMEDRLTGVVRQKFMVKKSEALFVRDSI